MARTKRTTDLETRTCKRVFQFQLTDKERVLRLEASEKMEKELDVKKDELKSIQAAKKAEIKSLNADRKNIRKVLQDNSEPREVQCKQTLDYKGGTVSYIFGKEVMETRPMQDHERQTVLGEQKKTKRTSVKSIKKGRKHSTEIEAPLPVSEANTQATAHA